MYTCLSRR